MESKLTVPGGVGVREEEVGVDARGQVVIDSTDFFQVGYGLLVSFCKYVPATGPQVTHGYLQKINLML